MSDTTSAWPPKEVFLTVWVIYQNPTDYPQGCVLRAQALMRDGTIVAASSARYASSVDELRAMLPPGLACLARHADDDPCIVETWL